LILLWIVSTKNLIVKLTGSAVEVSQADIESLPGLKITVGHWTLADQNLLMSDEIPNVVGHDVRTNFFNINHFTATMNKNLP